MNTGLYKQAKDSIDILGYEFVPYCKERPTSNGMEYLPVDGLYAFWGQEILTKRQIKKRVEGMLA